MAFRARTLVFCLAFCGGSAAAQSSRAEPAGPRVINDTIYSLDVDPADHPEETAVFLLDDGVVRFEADGRSSRTFRQVVQILRPEAVEDYREFSFTYIPGHERMTVNWIRVVKPGGEVVSDEPSFVQDSDVPAQRGDPVYSDQRVRRASVTGVEPGTIVDFSYTTEELKPFLPGDFMQWWGVSTGLAVRRSRFVVDVPDSVALRIREENLNFKRRTVKKNGRTVHTWATGDLPKVKGEPYAADSNDVYMSVAVSSPTTWEDIGRWYAGHARDRYALTPAVRDKLAAVLVDAVGREDSIRAVHRWVAQDIRYVSIALGMGGYQPRAPEEVLRTGFGDCKDKATLMVAALGAVGIEAYPVLLNSTGGVERALPSLSQLNHAIVAVRHGEQYVFIDPTSSLTPYGELPPSEQGEFGMIVRPAGDVEVVTLPQAAIDDNLKSQRLTGAITEEGLFTGWYEELATGALQYQARNILENELEPATRTKFADALARGFYPTATGDSLELFDGKDLTATPRIRVRIIGGRATRTSGRTEILSLPFGSMEGLAKSAAELSDLLRERGGRRFPIDAAAVTGDNVLVQELRLTLPAGWSAQLPQSVATTSVFGRYETEYAQTGQELRMTRRFTGARGIHPPDRIGELIRWFEEIGSDDAGFIVLEKGSAGALP